MSTDVYLPGEACKKQEYPGVDANMCEKTQQTSARIDMVDALRGFAVGAILLVHSLEHFIYNRYPEIGSPGWAAFNQAWKDAFFFLFAGKSYTIFALRSGLRMQFS